MSPAAYAYTEDLLVERPTIQLFEELGWETVGCFDEVLGPDGTLGRDNRGEVVLTRYLRPALQRLNPTLPDEALDLAVQELTRDRSSMSPAHANRDVYLLLRNGVRVEYRNQDEEPVVETVRVIDWDDWRNNEFLLASQLWISGEMYTRRADLVGFVNGLPLVFVELKASHKRLEAAYNDNLRDYRDTIPHVFWFNGLILLSSGSHTRVGSSTATWEHFAEWKRVQREDEPPAISLETAVRGTCGPTRLLDLVENFTLFTAAQGGLVKVLAKNHQYLGVNNAIAALQPLGENRGRLGVFWHTQGSGKSISMLFFAQKVHRKIPGNWTFVVVTDRQELDDQIYKNFADAGVVTEPHLQATSAETLRQLLVEDHRYVFTLIQKFRTERGATHPVLSERSDIVVMADEAHRSQYDTFALHMRNALPNAAFIGFTGTPLMAGEEKTREVFGDYASIYNFKQSADDGATVPLFYENRTPELELTNEDLNADMEQLLEDAALDPEQERALQREFSRQYHLITREDRLEAVAQDIVAHFMGRGQMGKAMVVSLDKATAVRMHDKVKAHWSRYLDQLRASLADTQDGRERKRLMQRIRYMEETDMAVVVSQSQNEVADMRDRGLDIVPHRKRMLSEDLETKFKDPDDSFRIVFVCAMWMTGFDVPSCNTIYLDKPMRNHTLMQTIARANRVFRDKVNGLIVDYVGIFRDLQRALAIYGSVSGGGVREGEAPVRDKTELIEQLRATIAATEEFLRDLGVDPDALGSAQGFTYIQLRDDAVEAILVDDQTKGRVLVLSNTVTLLFRAILPDPAANEVASARALFANIADTIRSYQPPADIGEVMEAVEDLLDESIEAEGYVIRRVAEAGASYETSADGSSPPAGATVDLSQIDFEALKQRFAEGRKRSAAERLKGALNARISRMVRLNRARADYLEMFQRMIDEYNSGSRNVEQFFADLIELARKLDDEERRTISEQLSEEELAIFDLLTRPDLSLTQAETKEVKRVARDLLETLKQEKLVLEWRKRQTSRAAVRLAIEEALDRLPPVYSADVYRQKCDSVYLHVYDAYFGDGRSIYAVAA